MFLFIRLAKIGEFSRIGYVFMFWYTWRASIFGRNLILLVPKFIFHLTDLIFHEIDRYVGR